jgi:hypothetical protein
MSMEKLISFLSSVPLGPIPATMCDEIFNLVVASWDNFSGSGETSMGAWKIQRDDGPEDVIWDPPCLSFVIERHGGTVLGSIRADRQRWTLNLESRTAGHLTIGFRQLRPNAPKLDVKPLADNVCKAVREGPSSASRLVSNDIVVWRSEDEVRVYHGKIVGGEYPQAISGRRKRLRADLKTKMKVIGWDLVSVGQWLTFRRTK